MNDIENKVLYPAPKHYQSSAGNPRIQGTASGLVGSSVQRIIKVVKKQVDLNDAKNYKVIDGTSYLVFKHGLGKVHEIFCRCKPKDSFKWQMFPTNYVTSVSIGGYQFIDIYDIGEQETLVNFYLSDNLEGNIYDFELYYTDLYVK